MPIDPFIDPTISHQIEDQFPEFFRDNGPVFVEFVRQYYRWMESEGQALYYARRMLDLQDIDNTLDDFIIHFKNKFLPNIQLESETNYRQLVKHSLDLYRSRGSERSINLLLRLIFAAKSTVYRPSTDVFRASDGKWVQPIYIEVVGNVVPSMFLNKQITGTISKATAFVENYVKKLNNGRLVHVFYLSNLVDNFVDNEPINLSYNPYNVSLCPVITGSMSSVSVVNGGAGFSVGDFLDAMVGGRWVGRVRVSGITDLSGATTFDLIDGGYGYTNNTTVTTSSKTLDVQCFPPVGKSHYFDYNETITQNTATGVIIAESSNVVVNVVGSQNFTLSETLTQTDTNGNLLASGKVTSTATSPSLTNISLINTIGVFSNSYPVIGQSSNASGNLQSVTVRVGVSSVNGVFTSFGNTSFVTSKGTTGNIVFVSTGIGSGATVTSNNLTLTETVTLFSDKLSSFANVALNSVYQFPNMPSANAATPIIQAVSSSTLTVGKIATLSNIQIGSGYSVPPLYRVSDPVIGRLARHDWVVGISGLTTSFVVGEVVTQPGGARGAVKTGSNNSVLLLQRLSINHEFVPTSSNNVMVFVTSGAIASVVTVDADVSPNEDDLTEVESGRNALLTANASSAQGSVSSVDVVDSGFAHTENETLQFVSGNNIMVGIVSTDTQGKSQGYYTNKGGFLSSDKKLYDGVYYQDFSYEVQSPVPFETYKTMLKEIVHVAGTKAFGALYHAGIETRELYIRPITIVQDNNSYGEDLYPYYGQISINA